jgi:hypothetical protein
VQFQNVIESPWLELDPIRLGDVPKILATADRFVVVEADEKPIARIDIYCDHSSFQEVIIWQNWVVIGIAFEVYLINVQTRDVQALHLGDYFGHLYPQDDDLYVASADRLFCLNPDGTMRWVSDVIGIDGVIVTNIDEEFIDGEGEWDPPGGWKPFRLDTSTGRTV